MRKAAALIRAQFLAAASYRVRMLLSVVGLAATVVPLYFLSGALQPVMADSIQTEGGQYFGFLLVGVATFYFLSASVSALPNAVAGGIANGVLEALLSTPIRLPSLVTGLIGFGLGFTALRALVLLLSGWILGASIQWGNLVASTFILALIVLAHLPFGILAASLVIAFRTEAALPRAVLALSALLGGVYYPTRVIPSWIQTISDGLPLTYGLRALRRVLLEGASLATVATDVGILALFAVGLLTLGSIALAVAMGYARRVGTLSQY